MKETNVKLDKKDWAILSELDGNSRQPLSSIAKRVRLSEQVVSYRIRRLFELGVITGFRAFISPAKLGYMTFKMFISLGNIPQAEEEKLVSRLVKNPSTMWIFSCSGRYDFVVLVSAKDPEHFRRFWSEFQEKHGKHVAHVDTAVNIYAYEFRRNYLAGSGEITPNTAYLSGSIEKEAVDGLDLEILGEISKDARQSNADIARKLIVSPEVVRYRLKDLVKKGVVQSFRIWVSPEALGMEFYKVILHLEHMREEQRKRMMVFCEQHSYITAFLECFGSWNAELEVDARNAVHLHQIMKEFRNEFGGVLQDYEPLRLYKCHKSSYMPG